VALLERVPYGAGPGVDGFVALRPQRGGQRIPDLYRSAIVGEREPRPRRPPLRDVHLRLLNLPPREPVLNVEEVKNTRRVRPEDLHALRAFAEDYPEAGTFLLYRGEDRLIVDGIRCVPVAEFLAASVQAARWRRRLEGRISWRLPATGRFVAYPHERGGRDGICAA